MKNAISCGFKIIQIDEFFQYEETQILAEHGSSKGEPAFVKQESVSKKMNIIAAVS